MNKDITLHINNMAYTVNVSEDMEKEIKKFFDLNKNHDTKELLAAYMSQINQHVNFKKELEKVSNKLIKY